MDKKILNEMFKNLLHIGNKTNYWNSKMKDYIYDSINGIHVINLIKTAKKLEEVKTELKELTTEGKKILFVATKLQARDSFEHLATEIGHYFVTEKWVPGLLTNFKTIKKRISTYLKLKRDFENGTFDVLTKKEKATKKLELDKLHRSYRGVKDMKKPPEVLVVVDGIYEKQSIKEANNLNLKIFSIFNTNGDDTIVSNLIPANTNSVKSIEYLANSFLSVLKGITVKRKPINKVIKRNPINKTIIKKPEVKKPEVKITENKTIKKDKVHPNGIINFEGKEGTLEQKIKKTEEKTEEKKSVKKATPKAKTTVSKTIKKKKTKKEEIIN